MSLYEKNTQKEMLSLERESNLLTMFFGDALCTQDKNTIDELPQTHHRSLQAISIALKRIILQTSPSYVYRHRALLDNTNPVKVFHLSQIVHTSFFSQDHARYFIRPTLTLLLLSTPRIVPCFTIRPLLPCLLSPRPPRYASIQALVQHYVNSKSSRNLH
jgi:hypothetical protein